MHLARKLTSSTVFLFQLLAVITLLAAEVFLQIQLIPLLLKFVILKSLHVDHSEYFASEVHQYIETGLLLVAITTLVLFFASGLYEEKIAYANRCDCSSILK